MDNFDLPPPTRKDVNQQVRPLGGEPCKSEVIACIVVMFVILCIGYALDRCLWLQYSCDPGSLVLVRPL